MPGGRGKGNIVIQSVYAEDTVDRTTTTTVPLDDTPPQAAEMGLGLTRTITPLSADSVMYVTGRVHLGFAIVAGMFAGLFETGSTSVKSFASSLCFNLNTVASFEVEARFKSGSKSLQTWQLRFGGDQGGTKHWNRKSGAAWMGNTLIASLKIEEVLERT